MKTFILALLITITLASVVSADCYFNGVAYQVGDKVGVFTCTNDGWKKL